MKKIVATTLSLLALATLSTGVFAPAESPLARAEGNANLHVAATPDFIAVANADALYLYNEKNGKVWQEYTHSNEIAQMAISGDELYFLDNAHDLYTLSASDLDGDSVAGAPILQNCDLFALQGQDLYHADVGVGQTTFYKNDEATGYLLPRYAPAFCVWNDLLYAVDGGAHLYEIDLAQKTHTQLSTLPTNTTAIAINAGTVYATNGEKAYAYALTELQEKTDYAACTPLLEEAGEYGDFALTPTALYATRGSEIRAYDLQTNEWKQTDALAKTSEKNIPTGDVESDLAANPAQFRFVKTAANALLIEVTLEAGAPAFTWLSSKRTESVTAIQISQTGDYALLAYRKDAASQPQTYLVDKTQVSENAEVQTQAYAEKKSGYLTGNTGLYKYPSMGLERLTEIPREAPILLVGEVNGLDCDYYIVEWENARGYIPKSHVSLFSGAPETEQTTQIGDATEDKDGIWRLAYILLGGVAICILVDYLILRKKSN